MLFTSARPALMYLKNFYSAFSLGSLSFQSLLVKSVKRELSVSLRWYFKNSTVSSPISGFNARNKFIALALDMDEDVSAESDMVE